MSVLVAVIYFELFGHQIPNGIKLEKEKDFLGVTLERNECDAALGSLFNNSDFILFIRGFLY